MTATDARPTGAEPADSDVEQLATAVDRAIGAVDALDDGARRAAHDMRSAIEAFHRSALVRIVTALRADPRGTELLFALVDEPDVRAVFALHGIIRADPLTRARQALDSVRPYLQSHGGDVELVRIEGGMASVRLQGSCSGCSMSAVTLRETVERALVEGVDEIARIEVLDDEPTTAFIPLASIGRKQETGWVQGPPVADVAPGAITRFDPEPASGGQADSFVITHVDQRIAVFRNECVHQGRSLDGGMLDDGVLTCPWHGFRFDASTGECLSAPGAQLAQVPTRIEDGHVWIRARGG